MKEACECANDIVSYKVQATELMELEAHQKYGEVKWSRYYYTAPVIDNGGEIKDTIKRTQNVYDGKPFEKISGYLCTNIVFLDEAKAQEFCDYLNNREDNKDK